ncbi:MAG: S8 family peptidase [Prevotellaceae bacterium]|jgi:hypothetical protein|nr:S8 family peptidase [Prevotellaceae bacterium]
MTKTIVHFGMLLALLLLPAQMKTQTTCYYIRFADKASTPYTLSKPSDYLSARALERRAGQNLPVDSTDIPVCQSYLDSLIHYGATIIHTSRWMNGATVTLDAAGSLNDIAALPFVVSCQLTRDSLLSAPNGSTNKRQATAIAKSVTGNASQHQIEMLGGTALHNAGFRGKGMLIAIMDNGFFGVNTLAAFDSVREHIIDRYNYVTGNENIYDGGMHGTRVFSTIAANVPGSYLGSAPDAEYLLYVSEDEASESLRECDNWIAAAERADSIGADIISTSLGYVSFDDISTSFPYSALDGQTARMSRAATIAARKGMIVLIAAGNNGASSHPYISVPADADSILTVGSVNAAGVYSPFSSIGTTFDNRLKPTLCAQGEGTALVDEWGNILYGNGTSFATPILAGVVASLWGAVPEWSNWQLIVQLIQSASLYTAPNNRMGYGIPNVEPILTDILSGSISTGIPASTPYSIYLSGHDSMLHIVGNRHQTFDITILDLRGHIKLSRRASRQLDINISSLPKGVYLVKTVDSMGITIQKIIKQ